MGLPDRLKTHLTALAIGLLLVGAGLAVHACGGGGGTTGPIVMNPTTTTTTTTITTTTTTASSSTTSSTTTTTTDPLPGGDVIIAVGNNNRSFQPQNRNVNRGTRVVWRWNDNQPHTTTSDTGVWDSGIRNQGAEFPFTFQNAGVFPYTCQVHGPPMVGTITVNP